jgi:hypothetical protein
MGQRNHFDLYICNALDPSNYSYAVSLISQYRILVAIVLTLVLIIVAGLIIRLARLKKGAVINSLLLFGLIYFPVNYLRQYVDTHAFT